MDMHLVLTVIGRDRPGLVSAVSETIAAGGGNWLDTRMASLAGQFAGMLLVAIAPEKADALAESLRKLETKGLRLIIEKSDEPAPAPPPDAPCCSNWSASTAPASSATYRRSSPPGTSASPNSKANA